MTDATEQPSFRPMAVVKALLLCIILIVIAGAGILLTLAPKPTNKEAIAASDVSVIKTYVSQMAAEGSSYEEIESSFWSRIPDGRIKRKGQRNYWGGAILLETQGSQHEMFKVTYTQVPKDACVVMVTAFPDRRLVKTLIGTVEGPFDVLKAKAECKDRNTLTWIFR